jgi:hypothetical protein
MSDARAVLALLAEHGVTASLIGGRVKLVGAERLSPAVLGAARAMRDGIAAVLAEPTGRTGHDCCACGKVACFGVGWSLRGPGGARWYCAECRPSREEVVAVAGGFGEPSAPHVEVHADWWRQPVEDWAEGWLVIRNMVSGVETIIDLRGV